MEFIFSRRRRLDFRVILRLNIDFFFNFSQDERVSLLYVVGACLLLLLLFLLLFCE